jgi:hypothetical protein
MNLPNLNPAFISLVNDVGEDYSNRRHPKAKNQNKPNSTQTVAILMRNFRSEFAILSSGMKTRKKTSKENRNDGSRKLLSID